MNNGKIMGGLVLAGAIALGYYIFTGGKEEEDKSLGELNTAKTKGGKVAQRKAVFAKLDEEGKVFPKNRNGVRKKAVKKKRKK